MLRKEDWMEIEEMARRGMYQKDIAAELGVDPRTVRRALRRGGAPPGKRPRARGSQLDPFKPKIDELLREGVWNGVVILRELQAVGYRGKLTLIRDYLGPKRALRPSRATVRFETEPGVQLQADWGKIRTVVADAERA